MNRLILMVILLLGFGITEARFPDPETDCIANFHPGVEGDGLCQPGFHAVSFWETNSDGSTDWSEFVYQTCVQATDNRWDDFDTCC